MLNRRSSNLDNSIINQFPNEQMMPTEDVGFSKLVQVVMLFSLLKLFMANYLGYMYWQYDVFYILIQFWALDVCIITALMYLRSRYNKKQGWLLMDAIISVIYKCFIWLFYKQSNISIEYVGYSLFVYQCMRIIITTGNKMRENKVNLKYEYIISILQMLIYLQVMLITIRWADIISWSWYSVFSISWIIIAASLIIQIVVILSMIESCLEYIKDRVGSHDVIGGVWFTLFYLGFSISPFIFIIQLCQFLDDPTDHQHDAMLLTLFIVYIAYWLLILLFTFIVKQHLKLYFNHEKPNISQTEQQKSYTMFKIQLHYRLIQISNTYFDFIKVTSSNKGLSQATSNNQSIVQQKTKLKAFEYLSKPEILASPVADGSNTPVIEEKCQICFDREPEIMLVPCQHGGVCLQCIEQHIVKSRNCFICREQITQFLRISKSTKGGQFSVKELGILN